MYMSNWASQMNEGLDLLAKNAMISRRFSLSEHDGLPEERKIYDRNAARIPIEMVEKLRVSEWRKVSYMNILVGLLDWLLLPGGAWKPNSSFPD